MIEPSVAGSTVERVDIFDTGSLPNYLEQIPNLLVDLPLVRHGVSDFGADEFPVSLAQALHGAADRVGGLAQTGGDFRILP